MLGIAGNIAAKGTLVYLAVAAFPLLVGAPVDFLLSRLLGVDRVHDAVIGSPGLLAWYATLVLFPLFCLAVGTIVSLRLKTVTTGTVLAHFGIQTFLSVFALFFRF